MQRKNVLIAALGGLVVAAIIFAATQRGRGGSSGDEGEELGSADGVDEGDTHGGGGSRPTKGSSLSATDAELEEGLTRCGARLETLRPDEVMTFSQLMRECSGLYARVACRDALREPEFERERVAEACRAAYCERLRPAPSFCTTELPSDAEFLIQFSSFSRVALARDLRSLLGREGADEIAGLMADLIYQQSQTELEVLDDGT